MLPIYDNVSHEAPVKTSCAHKVLSFAHFAPASNSEHLFGHEAELKLTVFY